MEFDIAGVTIERAAIAYRDLNSGQEIALNDLKLETGRIAENAEGKLEFATALKRNTPPLDAKLALNGKYPLKPESVALDFTAKLDESTIKGKAAMARAKVAAYDFDLNIDKLNLDRYLASSEKKQEKKPEKKDGPAQPAPKDKDADAPVDLSGLKGLNAKGRVEIGALQVQGLKLAAVKTEIHAADGRAEVGPHSANLYEGTFVGQAHAGRQREPRGGQGDALQHRDRPAAARLRAAGPARRQGQRHAGRQRRGQDRERDEKRARRHGQGQPARRRRQGRGHRRDHQQGALARWARSRRRPPTARSRPTSPSSTRASPSRTAWRTTRTST